jgi:hypothetical protein
MLISGDSCQGEKYLKVFQAIPKCFMAGGAGFQSSWYLSKTGMVGRKEINARGVGLILAEQRANHIMSLNLIIYVCTMG